MTKVMLNLENSFFKSLQEILAHSFSDTCLGFCILHLRVWKSPNLPFMWNTTLCSHLLQSSGLGKVPEPLA